MMKISKAGGVIAISSMLLPTAIIAGEINGDIKCYGYLELQPGSAIKGDIEYNLSEEEITNLIKAKSALAESENLRKRTIKDVDQAKKYSHISFVRDLVSSVDNFKRALDSLPEDKSDLPEPIKNLIIGLEIVEKEINSTFEKHNLKQISPLGEKFDYNFHQAMFEVPTNDTDPGIVIEVSQIGYLLHDRLVRPAMVGISKKIEENNLDNDN